MKKPTLVTSSFIVKTIACLSLSFIALVQDTLAENQQQPNVALIVIDTLRADYLPFYGFEYNTSPFMAKLAAKGVVFENSFATSSWTAPSTASILTGLFPNQHGVIMGRRSSRKLHEHQPDFKLNALPEEVTTVGEVFHGAGYNTFAVTDNGNIRRDAGFSQGFDSFHNFQNEGSDKVNAKIEEWKSGILSKKPYFLYIQYMDPHHPYEKNQPWFDTYKTKMKNLKASYLSEINYVDGSIERLSKILEWDTRETIVLITSDHGEEFLEHGRNGHGKSLYSEVVRVPLMIWNSKGANFAGKRVKANVTALDVLPTLAELANIPVKSHYEGVSLKKVAESGEDPALNNRPIYAHLWKRRKDGREVLMKATALNQERAVHSNIPKRFGLYNIEKDMGEQKNLVKGRQDDAKGLLAKLDTFIKNSKSYTRKFVIPQSWTDGTETDDGSEE